MSQLAKKRLVTGSLLSGLLLLGAAAEPPLAHAIPVSELEPNNVSQTATPLLRGQSGRGSIPTANPAEFDGWVIPEIQPGDIYCVLHSALNDNGDPVLSIFETASMSDIATAKYFDDDSGPDSSTFDDSLICGDKATRAGAAFIRADRRSGTSLASYEIFQIVYGKNEVLAEIEPNDTPATAQPFVGPVIAGQGGDNADFFSFYANAGERIVVMLDRDPTRPTPASVFQGALTVFGTDGVTDVTTLVAGKFTGEPSAVAKVRGFGALPAPSSGTYFVRVSKDAGSDGDYRLVVLVEGDSPHQGACCFETACVPSSNANCRGYFSGVGTSCAGDTDGDGIPNACDNCAQVGNLSQEDSDADQAGNACEDCLDDPLKTTPGACGCGTQDTDSDGDGSADCNDQCPTDGGKTTSGACGCGVPDSDANSNGVPDCIAGPDLKALALALLDEINTLDIRKRAGRAKTRRVNRLRTHISDILVSPGASSIVLSDTSLNLRQQINRFVRAAGRALQGPRKARLKNKTVAQTFGSKLAANIVE